MEFHCPFDWNSWLLSVSFRITERTLAGKIWNPSILLSLPLLEFTKPTVSQSRSGGRDELGLSEEEKNQLLEGLQGAFPELKE